MSQTQCILLFQILQRQPYIDIESKKTAISIKISYIKISNFIKKVSRLYVC